MRRLAVCAAVVAALGLFVPIATTGALAAGLFGTNLVVNGNAEAGPGAPSNGQVMKPPGWTTTGQFTAVQYGASGGFPDKTSPGPADRGKNFFAGGNAPVSTATQSISLAAAAAAIDAGSVKYTMSAWLGGYSGQDDNAKIMLIFKGAGGASLGQDQLGPVVAADRKGATGFVVKTSSDTVPKGARSATVTLTMTRASGSYNDGEADDVSLVLKKS
ncbi:MAG TPA: hypothetical protein VHT05_10400 [Candidatus Elarobacter sp.]|jgi:hypothetical protein|nr:hypothetical protein [Candidatus Elarobacter sp.]